MKILAHRHIGIIVKDFDLMLNFYINLGFSLRNRAIETGPFVNNLIGTKNIELETAKLVLEDHSIKLGYSFQIELMKVNKKSIFNSQKNKAINFNFINKSLGVLDLAFTVDDIHDVRTFILSQGGQLVGDVLQSPTGFPALHCYAIDPEGNTLHLAQNLSN